MPSAIRFIDLNSNFLNRISTRRGAKFQETFFRVFIFAFIAKFI